MPFVVHVLSSSSEVSKLMQVIIYFSDMTKLHKFSEDDFKSLLLLLLLTKNFSSLRLPKKKNIFHNCFSLSCQRNSSTFHHYRTNILTDRMVFATLLW